MDREQSESRDPAVGVPPAGYDRVISDTPAYGATARTRGWTPAADVMVGENVLPVRNRVQWGPVIAGSLIALGVLVVLAVLGTAVGASAFEPGTDITDWGSSAGIYGGISALIALFIGGWVAARSAAVAGPYAGLMNGLIAGITTVLAVITAAALGVDNVLGFFGANLANITSYVSGATSADAATQSAAFDNIKDGAWGTLIALLLGFGAAALGGYLGHNERQDLVQGNAAS